MAFSKVKTEGIADDAVTAVKVDDDGTGYTVGNLSNSGTLQQTGQVTLGSGGTNWTLPTSRGSNDKYVLQINGTTGASTWEQSLTAPEISSHNFDVSGSTDDGGINAYEAPYAYTGTTTNASTTISSLSSTTGLKAGQYISGAGIPANTTISSVGSGSIVISNQATAAASGVALKIQKTPGEKNGGKVILTGTNFGANVADLTVAITNSSGAVIANASYLSGLSGGTSITAEWTGTEGTYSTDLTSSYSGKIYFKITKSGLASGVYDTNTNLTTDATLSTPSQTGGDRSVDPSATSLGTYGDGRITGGGQDSNTKVLLNFDRGGGTDIEDSSNTGGDGYKVTAYNQASIKASPFGDGKTAMFFDGSNDYLSVGSSTDFDMGTGAFTIEWWMNHLGGNESDGDDMIFSQFTDANSRWYIQVKDGHDIKLFSRTSSTTHSEEQWDCNFGLGEWHHFALCRDSNGIRLYMDGTQKTGSSTSLGQDVFGFDLAWEIGRYADPGNYANMYLDEVRVVKGTAVYTSDFDVPTSRLTAITNTKLLIHSNQSGDSSSRQHTLSLHAPAFHGSSPARANWGGSNLVFDGSNDKIRISANPDFELLGSTSTNRTVDFWVYHTTNPASGGKMYLCQYDASSPYWEIRLDGSNINFSGSGSALGVGGAHGMSADTWYHIAVTKVGTACKIYVGGVLKASGTQNSTLDLSSNLLTIGARQHHGDMFWAGYMDEIRISDIDRTAAGQDLALSGTSFTPPTGAYTSDSNTTLLIHGDGAKFTDSSDGASDQSTAHNITPTGAFHSQDHKGIVSSQPWPANGKKFGASGVYFDGATDYLELGAASALGTGKFTIDFWMNFKRSDSTGNYVPIMGNSQSPAGYFNINLKKVGSAHNFYVYEDSTQNDSGYAVDDGLWHHCMITRNSDSYIELWVDGTRRYISGSTATTDYNSPELWRIGHDDQQSFYYKGYLDNIRIVIGEDMTSVSTDQVYSANGTTYTLPTRAYGIYGQETPDAGTITLVATGAGDYTWSEMSAGTALPGSLAVGSTAHSGSGDSRTHTATVTGSFSALTSSFANGTRSDLTTSGILLKAQNDADSTKAITLGSSGGYDGIGITQKSTEKPVLFNGRRYVGTGATRDINDFGFAPDFVWVKNRDATQHHALFDTVRGATKRLISNLSSDEDTQAQFLTAFNSDGYSIGSSSDSMNADGQAIVAWAWKAGGGLTATPTDADGNVPDGVTSVTQSASTTSGFSITKYTGNSSADGQFTHGLGGIPEWIMGRITDAGCGWFVWHKGLASSFSGTSHTPANDEYIRLDENYQKGYFTNSAVTGTPLKTITDTVINLDSTQSTLGGITTPLNKNSGAHILYAWRGIAGVSAFGKYEGTGGAWTSGNNGGAIDVGFKPKFLMLKNIDENRNWIILDSFRDASDTTTTSLYPNLNNTEYSNAINTTDFNSTGFKFTGSTTNNDVNESNKTYIYMAFA